MSSLRSAASQGDQRAINELAKLEEERANKQEELDKLINDRSYELKKEGLQDQYEAYEEIERWKENSDKQTVCFMKINLFYKIGETWSKPALGIGGAPLISSEKNGIYLSDEAYKMAYTDAISVACKALGMAADIYFNKDIKTRENKTKYDEPETKKESKQAVGSASDDFPEEEFAQGDEKENFEIELASALQEIIAAQNRGSLLQIHHNYKNTNVSTDIRYIKALESASKKYPKNA